MMRLIFQVSLSKPKRNFDLGKSDVVVEHQEYMEALMRKLKAPRCLYEDPFTIVENSTKKYHVYDEATHWKQRKPMISYFFYIQITICFLYVLIYNMFFIFLAWREVCKCWAIQRVSYLLLFGKWFLFVVQNSQWQSNCKIWSKERKTQGSK